MHKLIISALIFCFSIPTFSQESNNKHKSYIDIGYTGGTYSDMGAVMGVYGAAGVFFKSFGRMSAVDFRAKEVYISYPQREAGAITVTYRLFLTKGFYVGGGFAHNHEIDIHNYVNDIVGSTMGNSKHIIHRSGGVLETGYNFRSFFKKGWLGIYPVLGASIAYLPGDTEPNPFFTLSAGFRFGFKRIDTPPAK